jgi:hypothetical protein
VRAVRRKVRAASEEEDDSGESLPMRLSPSVERLLESHPPVRSGESAPQANSRARCDATGLHVCPRAAESRTRQPKQTA